MTAYLTKIFGLHIYVLEITSVGNVYSDSPTNIDDHPICLEFVQDKIAVMKITPVVNRWPTGWK